MTEPELRNLLIACRAIRADPADPSSGIHVCMYMAKKEKNILKIEKNKKGKIAYT
jgi:hypothetical protein